MLRKGKWLILETEQDFLSRWDEYWGRWNHSVMKRPDHFPCAFQYQEPFDNYECGSWKAISLELAKDNIERGLKEDIALFEEMLSRLHNLKKA